MSTNVNEEGFVLPQRPKRKKKQQSWELSYGDLVTALLCFFIIFYVLEKQVEKRAETNPLKGYDKEEGILKANASTGVDTDFDYAVEDLGKVPEIAINKTAAFVDIRFKQTIFFAKGSTVLTPEGQEIIDTVLSKIAKFEGKYIMEIQGHADSTPVKTSPTRWWKSNMELSVLRALNVHSYIADRYKDKDSLIVSGYGSQQKLQTEATEADETNRRISLRLQLAK